MLEIENERLGVTIQRGLSLICRLVVDSGKDLALRNRSASVDSVAPEVLDEAVFGRPIRSQLHYVSQRGWETPRTQGLIRLCLRGVKPAEARFHEFSEFLPSGLLPIGR